MRRTTLLLAAIVGALGCHRAKRYDANVEVTRVAAVRRDEVGKPLTVDFEFRYLQCPGTQVEVIRGDAAFAACVARYRVGETVPISIDHVWNDEGHYEWTVRGVGTCPRFADPSDEASYAMVRECDDWSVNGQRVGFECNYTPEKKLIAKCPWFRRR